MTSTHKTYATELKLDIAAEAIDQNLNIKDVIKTTGVGITAINRWVR